MTQYKWLLEWGTILLRAFIRTLLICLSLYGLYRVKSSLGINLSQHYHAIDVFETPIKVIVDMFPV